jgi:hypothetical protein
MVEKPAMEESAKALMASGVNKILPPENYKLKNAL